MTLREALTALSARNAYSQTHCKHAPEDRRRSAANMAAIKGNFMSPLVAQDPRRLRSVGTFKRAQPTI